MSPHQLSIGSFSYKGVSTQQARSAFDFFYLFFTSYRFQTVIEIGTSSGGLSLFLYEQSRQYDFHFRTYDISDQRLRKSWTKAVPFKYVVANCFDPIPRAEIINDLARGRCLLLCDGGNKVKEFQTFGPHLRSGSYIMAHDYSESREFFDAWIKGRSWNWLEIQDSDVQATVEQSGLVKAEFHSVFRWAAWACFKKP